MVHVNLEHNLKLVTYRAYEVWGGPEGLAREIWDRKKAYEESERYRKGIYHACLKKKRKLEVTLPEVCQHLLNYK